VTARRITAADGARIVALAAIYIAAARLGLALDAVSGFATLVWAPSGIALAAMLLFGYRIWPGVFLGALAANAMVGAPIAVALVIGAGNTLEAVAATYALRHVPGFSPALRRVRDVLALILLGAGISTLVSATVGVAALHLSGIVGGSQLMEAWRAWWVGDLIGDLLVAPLILVWATRPRRDPRPLDRARALELGALAVSLAGVALVVFFSTHAVLRMWPYMLFPLLAWAALRFGLRGAATSVFVTSSIAIWGTTLHRGSFAEVTLRQSLLELQLFMGVVAATFIVLAATIAERRAAELQARAARDEAERANKTKAEFLAAMSHELRTPLNAISGFVDLLLTGTQGSLTEKQMDSLTRVQRNQRQLQILITDLLSFARTEAGQMVLKPARVRVTDATRDAETAIHPELRDKQLCFEQHSIEERLSVWADPARLEQILVNLLSNATKYTDTKGTVALGAERQGEQVRIWVRDSGIGIPEAEVDRVFEPFYQVDRGTTRRYRGVGLGLTIARDLARAMNGDITLESRVGTGTTVSLFLPVAQAEASSRSRT